MLKEAVVVAVPVPGRKILRIENMRNAICVRSPIRCRNRARTRGREGGESSLSRSANVYKPIVFSDYPFATTQNTFGREERYRARARVRDARTLSLLVRTRDRSYLDVHSLHRQFSYAGRTIVRYAPCGKRLLKLTRGTTRRAKRDAHRLEKRFTGMFRKLRRVSRQRCLRMRRGAFAE